MFIILEWSDIDQISVLMTEDGNTEHFSSYAKANDYAKLELNFEWQIVEI